jgi:hypothetical protein
VALRKIQGRQPASQYSVSSRATFMLIGRLLADERGKGFWGKPGGFPVLSPQRTRRSQRRERRGDP